MKIEQLIVQYLYLSKQVTLQGIGTFKLDPSIILPAGNDKEKDFPMPENAFQFEYNLKAGEDEGLVKYIVQHTHKILPLASSDLESYVMLAKQFLNIGKPLVIAGVGTVQKNQQGNYQFIPGVFITPKIDDIPKQAREKRDESVSFESEAKVNNSRRNLLLIIGTLVIIMTGLGIFYLVTQKRAANTEPITNAVLNKDSVVTDTVKKIPVDTSIRTAPAPVKKDSFNFKIVIRNYPDSAAAAKALKKFTGYGHALLMLTEDSVNYELAMPFTSPLSDTTRAKDSLRKIFEGRPSVRL